MTRSQMTNWNKGTKVGTRAVGATAGAIATGGVGAAATGYGIGALTDPLVDAILPTFTNNQMIKHNISTGTMADNYQYGKTDDAYSLLSNMSKDPMEKFNKGLNYADTTVSLIGAFAGGIGANGAKVASSGELAGEMSSGVVDSVLNTNSGVAANELSTAKSSSLLNQKTLFDFNNSTVAEIEQHAKTIVPEKPKVNVKTIFDNVSDWIGDKQNERKQNDENKVSNNWFDTLDKDLEEEYLWNENFTTPYQPMTTDDKWTPFKNLTDYFKRKRNIAPSYTNSN